jgi:hypothetical protein
MTGSSHKEIGMRARRLTDERGIALAVAVFALVVIGALVAGTFFAGRLEQQTGTNTFYAAEAAEAAEAGLSEAIAGQTAASLLALKADVDSTATLAAFTVGDPANGVSASRSVRWLNNNLFLVRSLGARTSTGGTQLAARSLAQLVRLVQADLDVNAGLTALGDVTVSGGAEVTGNDAIPLVWASKGVSCPPLDTVTGVLYNNGILTAKGNGSVTGDPESAIDPTLNPTDLKSDFDKLKVLATLILTNGNPVANGPAYTGNPQRCDTAVETNWGEPTPVLVTDPCFNYFPVIYYNGHLRLQGGRGQGILLVEGDLTATGGLVFYGPVFVTGTLSTAGNSKQGAKFFGGVIAGNVSLEDMNKLSGGAMVSYSSCALKRALDNTATPTALAERSWVQLYQ